MCRARQDHMDQMVLPVYKDHKVNLECQACQDLMECRWVTIFLLKIIIDRCV